MLNTGHTDDRVLPLLMSLWYEYAALLEEHLGIILLLRSIIQLPAHVADPVCRCLLCSDGFEWTSTLIMFEFAIAAPKAKKDIGLHVMKQIANNSLIIARELYRTSHNESR